MPTPLNIAKEIKDKIKASETYKATDEEKAAHNLLSERKQYLKTYRENSKIEEIWKAADKAYHPYNTIDKKKKVLVSDDELGWRSKPIVLGAEDDWQEDSIPPNVYIKIQTALGIIVDRNPTASMSPAAKKYEKNTMLMKNLYEDSWNIAMSKKIMLKPLVFNCAKYGIGVGRTFPLTIKRDVRDLEKYVPENPKKNIYKNVTQTYFDGVFRESLSPWQVWFDDNAKIGDPFSCNDVVYYKDYEWQKLKTQFGHLQNFKYLKPELKYLDKNNKMSNTEGDSKGSKMQERIWFYENLELDTFIVETESGVVLVNEPMPQTPKNKKLSVYSAPWTMRNDKDINGIGMYEAMRNDNKMYTKYRNMTMDQVVLSIYKEFFYSGTDSLEADGKMVTRPGVGRQVTDPKNIKWNEIPGPGADAWNSLDYMMARIDDVTGISKSLQGEITGSTAFEISQARESALKRMKTPLENITDALEVEAYISLGIIEDLYSVPKIKLLAEDRFIEPFEIDNYETSDGQPLVEGRDYEKQYREPSLAIKRNEDTGVISKTQTKTFFKLKPEEDFPWDGIIKITGQSIIANSELLDRTTTVEMANLVVPLFSAPREIAEKPAREIIKAYNKDPEDWLPDAWLQPAQNSQDANPQNNANPTPTTSLFTSSSQTGTPQQNPNAAPQTPPQPPQIDMSSGVGTKIPAANNLANSLKTMGK